VRGVLIVLGLLLLADQARGDDAHVIAINVAPEQTCPAPRQVIDALAARLPGAVLPPGQPARPRMLRLAIATDPTGGVRIDFADPEGVPLLHRVLAPTRGPGECAALADTIALIIERYWREVGYDAPPLAPPPTPPPAPTPPPPPASPPPPPAPTVTVEAHRVAPPAHDDTTPGPPHGDATPAPPWRWSAAAAVAGRAGDAGARDASALIAVAVEGRIGFRLSGGVSTGTTATLDTGQADFRRFPFRLGGYVPIRVGVGQLEPGLGVDLDLISFSVRGDAGMTNLRLPESCSGRLCRAPGADLALGWSYASSHHIFVRALARLGLAASYNFDTLAGSPPMAERDWRTPSTYLEVGLESGLCFP
jgi:hypothetical protein